MSTLTARDLQLTFGGRNPVEALRSVSVEALDGTMLAVLGPSGCGKTTLLRALAGMERCDGGTIHLGERVLAGPGVHLPPERRAIGIVPQEGALFPHLDVARNVSFGLQGLARARRRTRVDEMLELVGLPGLHKRRPHQLSGGQQQRVALARALAPAPEVVLLDEPFSALDTGLRASLRAQVMDLLGEAGITSLLVTHDQVEALTMADTLAVMREGEIIQVGPPHEVYRRPADPWTAGFLGDAVLVPGRRTGDHRVRCALGELALAADFDHHDGSDVTVFCRPEQIQPASPGSTSSGRSSERRGQPHRDGDGGKPAVGPESGRGGAGQRHGGNGPDTGRGANGPLHSGNRPDHDDHRRRGARLDGGGDGVEAGVATVRFLGPDLLVDLEIDADHADTAPLTLTARWPSSVLPEPGDRVRVAVTGPVLAYPPAGDDPPGGRTGLTPAGPTTGAPVRTFRLRSASSASLKDR